jgi:hypothetical protein
VLGENSVGDTIGLGATNKRKASWRDARPEAKEFAEQVLAVTLRAPSVASVTSARCFPLKHVSRTRPTVSPAQVPAHQP